jgi:hypothetical protein
MPVLMPYPRPILQAIPAGANHRACITSGAIWFAASIGSFGEYLTCAAAQPVARFVRGPSVYHLLETAIKKYEFEAFIPRA